MKLHFTPSFRRKWSRPIRDNPRQHQTTSTRHAAKLAAGDLHRTFTAGRPLKSAAFQAAIEQPEAVMIPIQNLEFIAFAVAEHKETQREGGEPEAFLNDHSQSVDGLAQIR
ncbi:hypothetical protein ASG81_25390 [Paenibacillus sp. Soil522]|nr:hypothetical protein ASG81_25390 [Paenibacillus sp. Soil522]